MIRRSILILLTIVTVNLNGSQKGSEKNDPLIALKKSLAKSNTDTYIFLSKRTSTDGTTQSSQKTGSINEKTQQLMLTQSQLCQLEKIRRYEQYLAIRCLSNAFKPAVQIKYSTIEFSENDPRINWTSCGEEVLTLDSESTDEKKS